MPERALAAIRAAIAHNSSGYHEVSPDLFGTGEKAIDALKGFVGALIREYPGQRFEVHTTPEILRRLGLATGYLSIGSEMVFVRHRDTHVAGHVRIVFGSRT